MFHVCDKSNSEPELAEPDASVVSVTDSVPKGVEVPIPTLPLEEINSNEVEPDVI